MVASEQTELADPSPVEAATAVGTDPGERL